MAASIKAVRGMNDVLPAQTPYWHVIEKALHQLAQQYGYREMRLPIVESTALFKRSIGEVTDIVEKEMYTFEDRNGDSLTLRPEGTAGCVRAGIQNSLFYNQVQRLWYMGPMFRHERPQKGRYRQFYQFGLEAFGMQGPDIDVEQILFAKRLWQLLGLSDHITLEINTLGTAETRAAYRTLLVNYFESHADALDEDSKRRLSTNPLRILDSKNPAMQSLNKNAPKMIDHLDEASAQEFKQLTALLDALGVAYQVNPTLVRGLDYYSHTVYEWVTDSLGAQGTVCAGGRYDALLQQLGEKKPVPAVGFALGIERLVLMLEQVTTCEDHPDVCLVLVGDDAVAKGLLLAEQLRDQLPMLGVECNLSAGSFKSQFKRADKSGARWALVIADDELTANTATIKDLREGSPQQTIAYDAVAEFFKKLS